MNFLDSHDEQLAWMLTDFAASSDGEGWQGQRPWRSCGQILNSCDLLKTSAVFKDLKRRAL